MLFHTWHVPAAITICRKQGLHISRCPTNHTSTRHQCTRRYLYSWYRVSFLFFHSYTYQLLLGRPWSQVSSLLPRFLPSIFFAHRVQQSHCSSTFDRVLLTYALALSAGQLVHKQRSPRIYTSMHPRGFELTKLTYTKLEDNLIRHRGDRL